MARKQSATKQPATQQPTGTSYLEWAVAAVGTVLVAAAIAYLVWYGIARPDGPPELAIRQLSEIQKIRDGYLVEVEVENYGHSTAAAVEISGTLEQGGTDVEDSSATIDYVPQQSTRQAFFQFSENPADYTLKLRVKGMAKP
ncbi:hypothetical protein A7A08_01529 [Methyloligella halotolerans]|uniref:TIGR02588 family protein n=1 Tax=Methyloligella halotolerans TaxID=1177755 RepID=A0A1E2RZ30_9HYPH|nr:hypothetical protein [Methyloligella halotolerans]ODA67496.1 hypothetical protein A7A08_01529 [Methyloligella halotolerans]